MLASFIERYSADIALITKEIALILIGLYQSEMCSELCPADRYVVVVLYYGDGFASLGVRGERISQGALRNHFVK